MDFCPIWCAYWQTRLRRLKPIGQSAAINGRASLTLPEREAVQITAAATHGCSFCVVGHTAIAHRKANMEHAVVDGLRAGNRFPIRASMRLRVLPKR